MVCIWHVQVRPELSHLPRKILKWSLLTHWRNFLLVLNHHISLGGVYHRFMICISQVSLGSNLLVLMSGVSIVFTSKNWLKLLKSFNLSIPTILNLILIKRTTYSPVMGVLPLIWALSLTVSAADAFFSLIDPYKAIFLERIPIAPSTMPRYLTEYVDCWGPVDW